MLVAITDYFPFLISSLLSLEGKLGLEGQIIVNKIHQGEPEFQSKEIGYVRHGSVREKGSS